MKLYFLLYNHIVDTTKLRIARRFSFKWNGYGFVGRQW